MLEFSSMEKSVQKLDGRKEWILASLASAEGASFNPVHVQKLFFLLDEKIAHKKFFDFKPYDYGPFDVAVYEELIELQDQGYVEIRRGYPCRRYRLTPKGIEIGKEELAKFQGSGGAYIGRIAKWICELSFSDLVASIYKAYPRMRENSVFYD